VVSGVRARLLAALLVLLFVPLRAPARAGEELTLNAAGDVLSGPGSSCADCTVRLERVE
jgi:hypothetical protein